MQFAALKRGAQKRMKLAANLRYSICKNESVEKKLLVMLS
jgi:hypothetical protein